MKNLLTLALVGLLSVTALAQTRSFGQATLVVGGAISPVNLQIPESGLTLLQVVASVGGVKSRVAEIEISRLMSNGNSRETIKVNLDEIRHRRTPDIQIQPWDVIYLPSSNTN